MSTILDTCLSPTLLIVCEVDADERDVSGIAARVTALTGNACEPFGMSETEFAQIDLSAPELATHIKADAVSLLDDEQ